MTKVDAKRAFRAGMAIEGRAHFDDVHIHIGDETLGQVIKRQDAAFAKWWKSYETRTRKEKKKR